MTILLIFQLLPLAVAQETSLNRRKNETVAQADRIFGERYAPVAGKPIRLFDKQTETRPPDAIIYLHGSSYVIELVFAADGTIAGILLRPESLLYSNYWGDVPSAVELSRAEMQWLVASANEMQPLGKATEIMEAPDGCFQSGPNLYCTDHYELALVRHYHLVRGTRRTRQWRHSRTSKSCTGNPSTALSSRSELRGASGSSKWVGGGTTASSPE
jgi:hypothetical protein